MGIRLVGTRNRENPFLQAGLAIALISAMWTPLLPKSSTAQAPTAQSPATQSPVPDWQTAAGGKMEFEVASIKQNATAPSRSTVNSNIPLGPQDMFAPTGGLLSATNWPLTQYMVFAYKLTPNQVRDLEPQLPKWASTDRFDIQARSSGNPTKDQFRLMMQALLADRFKLAIHFETREVPVFALVPAKPGKTGPRLQPHSDQIPCSTASPCGRFDSLPNPPGQYKIGARNVPLAMLASTVSIPEITGVNRPVLDKTGLTGTYDFVIEFTPQFTGPLPPGANFQPDPTGPTFLEALKEQLGLKLESQTGPVDVIVVDHVDHPSEN